MSEAYQMISRHYGDRTAERSGVPLMNHIDEGLAILNHLNASQAAKDAFCLHPMFQADENLARNLPLARTIDSLTVMLVMEYRNIANAYLSDKPPSERIHLSPLRAINLMLIADKVQNFKDFQLHHQRTHPRTNEITAYFVRWLLRLGVDMPKYARLKALIT